MSKPLALLVGSVNDYSPIKYLIKSFNLIGWDTFVISDVDSDLANVSHFGACNIAKIIESNKLVPQFLLFVEGGEMGIFPTRFDQIACPTIWWGIDTQYDYLKHLRVSSLFDLSLIAQKTYVDQLVKDGIKSVKWFPLASPIHNLVESDRDIDVSYVGSTNWNLYPQRGEYLRQISTHVKNSIIGSLPSSKMLETYCRSKIVFNHSLKNDINMRVFEAMGCGALLITDPILNNGMEDLFTHGVDYVSYKNSSDLVSKIENLLQEPSRLSEIAKSGAKKVHRFHTYDVRVKQITQHVESGITKSAHNRFQESAALLSMGIISDSIRSFSAALKNEARGRRAKCAYIAIAPLLLLAASAARLIEKAALARRLFS
jgi:hypothetical protein